MADDDYGGPERRLSGVVLEYRVHALEERFAQLELKFEERVSAVEHKVDLLPVQIADEMDHREGQRKQSSAAHMDLAIRLGTLAAAAAAALAALRPH